MKQWIMIIPLVALAATKDVTYTPGDINLILTVPHDGEEKPEIPIRQPGCKNTNNVCEFPGRKSCRKSKVCKVGVLADSKTQSIGRTVLKHFKILTGRTPHLIMSNLHRSRMDPNREIGEAAQGNKRAVLAYQDFHKTIRTAKKTFGRNPGLLIDIHGQAHKKNTTEIGYLIKDEDLNSGEYAHSKLSIKALVTRNKETAELKDFISGNRSLGALFVDAEYQAVPSPNKISPGKDEYFNGGYITSTYGSWYGGLVDAIQLEIPGEIRTGGMWPLRRDFSIDLAHILATYFSRNYEELDFD